MLKKGLFPILKVTLECFAMDQGSEISSLKKELQRDKFLKNLLSEELLKKGLPGIPLGIAPFVRSRILGILWMYSLLRYAAESHGLSLTLIVTNAKLNVDKSIHSGRKLKRLRNADQAVGDRLTEVAEEYVNDDGSLKTIVEYGGADTYHFIRENYDAYLRNGYSR